MSATTSVTVPRHATGSPGGGRARRLLRGPQADPGWARPALCGLLALTALLYLWDLGRNGWANDFYAAAVQAGTKSWKAFFFGSFDSSNFITVDKTPGSLWVMEISGRVFGFSQWSMLAPQALEGVGSVLLLYAAVKRWFGPAAGLIAGLVLALTPVAALMFRFNNPDALLVLLMTAAAYTLVRAVENGRSRWLVLTGLLLGFAFLAKMLQAFLVLPGFAVTYLWAGPPRLGRRIWQTVLMGAGVIAGAGWWILAAELTPAAMRPYFGGSTSNNILQLAIGYNGLGRLTGNETGSVGPGGAGGDGGGGGGGGQGASFGGATGIFRLFHAEFGGQISWLLPAALISLAAMAWVSRRAPRTDRTRAAALLWGGWVLVTGLVFSYMNGIIHPYYMVALAPGIAALTGIGAMALAPGAARAGRADRGRGGRPGHCRVGVRPARPDAGLAAVAALGGAARGRGRREPGAGGPQAGARWRGLGARGWRWPWRRSAWPWWPGWPGRPLRAGHGGYRPYRRDPERRAAGGRVRRPGGGGGVREARGGFAGGTTGQFPRGGFEPGPEGLVGSRAPAARRPGPAGPGQAPRPGGIGYRRDAGAVWSRRVRFRLPAAGGGLGGDTTVSSALTRLLEQDAGSYKWVAATEGSEEAAPLELATGDAVMAIGGFNGTDPWPTLAVFKELVAKHEIHYYVGQGSQSFGGGRGSSAIAAWVAAHFTKQTVGGQTVYDLTKPLS